MINVLLSKLHALEYTIHNMEQSLEEEAEAEREDQQQQAGTVREITATAYPVPGRGG